MGGPLTVEEPVSAVLRRQVPVRFGELPQSWLGGLPMMPDDVPWPRVVPPAPPGRPARGAVPLHFVAQIACAELPPDLWGGLGPRDGWLLLFVNAQMWDVGDDPRVARVIHEPALGTERPPPADLPPVRDETYEGYQYKHLRSQNDIPPTWRRWPVDIVTVSNHPLEGERWPATTPEDFASVLYAGAPVDRETSPIRPAGDPPDVAEWPYTWRGALYVVDSVIRSLTLYLNGVARVAASNAFDRDMQRIEEPGWVSETLAAIAAAEANFERRLAEPLGSAADATQPGEAERMAQGRARIEARHAQLARSRAYLHDGGTPFVPSALAAKLRASRDAYDAWLASRGPALDALRARILEHDLDGPMSADEFRRILDALAADTHEYWAMVRGGTGVDRAIPVPIRMSLTALAARGFDAALWEVAADLYVASPAHRELIPKPLLARCEPRWRTLYDNRPHRMGGLYDGVQSTPDPGPTSRVLLFQLATDNAMQWSWGDAGALYVTIDVARLDARDFSTVETWLESH